ncbi:MAG: hypothetical protein HQL35_14000 [Alphaproteobacteria bacterium]|nr:hypothetical protein [Alphaproteobacteria bacterium]
MKKHFKILFLSSAIALASTGTASAAMAVIDTAAIAKLTDQLNKAVEQIKQLTDLNAKLQAQIDAIGKAGQIVLPNFNSAKIASQIQQDLECLKPDLSKLMPSIEFEDVEWNSVCQASSAFRQTLWLDPKKLNKMPVIERNEAIRKADSRRENVLSKSAEGGLALAEIAAKDVRKTLHAADELESQVKAAKDERAHIATIAQGQVLLARSLAQQNQILAQMLKVQSAFVIKAGVPVESLMSEEDDAK